MQHETSQQAGAAHSTVRTRCRQERDMTYSASRGGSFSGGTDSLLTKPENSILVQNQRTLIDGLPECPQQK